MAILYHLTLRQTRVVADESMVVDRLLPLIGLVVHRLSSLRTLKLDFVRTSNVHVGRASRGLKDR